MLLPDQGAPLVSRMNRTRPNRPTATALRVELLESRNLLSVSVPNFDDLGIDLTRYDAGRIIVAVQDPMVGRQMLSAVNPAVARLGDDLGHGLFSVFLGQGVSVERAIAYFRAQSWVRYAQPDYVVGLLRVPNDPAYGYQWGLNNTGQSGGTVGAHIGANAAWDVTTGNGSVIVAVIDTGVDYTHPDLAGNMWRNSGEIPGNGIDDDGNGYTDDVYGWDWANNDNNPMDDNGHGTHVAGIIGAIGNNGVGVSGVAWNVQIMALKFLNSSGSGQLSNAIKALNYAVAMGAKVSNNSYSGGGYFQAFADAIAAAGRAGHIFVAAAGNNGQNNDVTPTYPASYNLDNIIAVTATDRNDRLASFSNWGPRTVDIAAPGVQIYSTYKGGGYLSMSGTSMAAPFVAGAVALLRDANPTWSYRQIIDRLLSTADPIPSLEGKMVSGGRLNLARALATTSPPSNADTRGPSVVSATFLGDTSGTFNRVRVVFSEAVQASTFTVEDVISLTRNGAAISGVQFTVTPVTGTNNQFDITFTTQSVAGNYALTFGPDIRDFAGNPMDQNGNGVNGEPGDRYTAVATLTTTRTFWSPFVPRNILDFRQTVSYINITQNLTIERLAVKLTLNHTYVSDLRIWLQSPSGTWILLFNQRGGNGQNINTTFDDRASTAIADGTAPYTGWFKPERPLSTLAGENARGRWTLVIEDLARYDTGRLLSWGLMIDSGGNGMARIRSENSSWTEVGAVETWYGNVDRQHPESQPRANPSVLNPVPLAVTHPGATVKTGCPLADSEWNPEWAMQGCESSDVDLAEAPMIHVSSPGSILAAWLAEGDLS
jgi:subtilisin family serine protease/subtilisin-like proprotein convertase family protein